MCSSDLHRTLAAYLDFTNNGTSTKGGKARRALVQNIRDNHRVLDEGQLIQVGEQCSSTERNAEQAERSLLTFLVMQFLNEEHLGDEFTGIITGSSSSGVFVSLERFLVEGMARFHTISRSSKRADRWVKMEGTGRIVAEKSGAVLSVGDRVTAQITAIDLPTRQMELGITQMPQRHIEDIVEPDTPRRKSKNRSGKKSKSKRKGKGRKRR